ncbi:hypothetical protein D3C73_1343590 [compost metagenome]
MPPPIKAVFPVGFSKPLPNGPSNVMESPAFNREKISVPSPATIYRNSIISPEMSKILIGLDNSGY